MPIVLLLHGEPWTEAQSLIRSGVDEILHHQDFTEFQVRIRNMIEINRLRKEAILVTSQVEKRVSEDVSEAERITRLKRYLSPQLVAAVLSGDESHVLKPTRQEVIHRLFRSAELYPFLGDFGTGRDYRHVE